MAAKYKWAVIGDGHFVGTVEAGGEVEAVAQARLEFLEFDDFNVYPFHPVINRHRKAKREKGEK
jgi:hypothetical protein